LPLAAAALIGFATREVRVSTGALFGGGDEVSGAWRFWPHRMRVGAGLHAPAPWGGFWGVDAFSERQPFTDSGVRPADHDGATLELSDWLTGHMRWTVTTGVDAWAPENVRLRLGGQLRFAALKDRLDGAFGMSTWPGQDAFGTLETALRVRSSTATQGIVFLGTASFQFATALTPLDVWSAGDTGHVRSALLRAHPLLDDGRFRVERLGRGLGQVSLEAQRWWALAGPIRAGAAVFGDAARTAARYDGTSRRDVDVGVGARLAVTGIPGVFSANIAQGLADGAMAFSVTYQP
jgi:hypothetical protein